MFRLLKEKTVIKDITLRYSDESINTSCDFSIIKRHVWNLLVLRFSLVYIPRV